MRGCWVPHAAWKVIPDQSTTGIAFALGTVDGAVMASRPSHTSRKHWTDIHYLQSRVSFRNIGYVFVSGIDLPYKGIRYYFA